jgi:hypothetical protein
MTLRRPFLSSSVVSVAVVTLARVAIVAVVRGHGNLGKDPRFT